MICLRMGKNLTAKIPPGDFQVTTPKTPLLSQQAVTSGYKEGIPSTLPIYSWTLLTNLQLNPYPNTQSNLFYSDSSPFWCMAPNMWLTIARIPVHDFKTPIWKRLLAAKFFSSSTRWRSGRCLVIKPYGANTQQLLQEREMN